MDLPEIYARHNFTLCCPDLKRKEKRFRFVNFWYALTSEALSEMSVKELFRMWVLALFQPSSSTTECYVSQMSSHGCQPSFQFAEANRRILVLDYVVLRRLPRITLDLMETDGSAAKPSIFKACEIHRASRCIGRFVRRPSKEGLAVIEGRKIRSRGELCREVRSSLLYPSFRFIGLWHYPCRSSFCLNCGECRFHS